MQKIPSKNLRDYFPRISLVANLLGDVLVKKSVAFWQRMNRKS